MAATVSTPAPAAPVAAPPAGQPAVTPMVDVNARPSPTPNTALKSAQSEDTALEVGAGAIALLVLGGAAVALTRRRRLREELADEAYEPSFADEAEPVEAAVAAPIHKEQPAIIAPSAFAWDDRPSKSASDDDSDRRPGETWVERAYRGPSPANPSASLRNRLKRAAFFDKREREVAAGTAEPVETDAGLPEAMADEREREFA